MRPPHVRTWRLHGDGPHGSCSEQQSSAPAEYARVDQLHAHVRPPRRLWKRHIDAHVVVLPPVLLLKQRVVSLAHRSQQPEAVRGVLRFVGRVEQRGDAGLAGEG